MATFNSLQDVLDYALQHPEDVDRLIKDIPGFGDLWRVYQGWNDYASNPGSDPNELYKNYNGSMTLNPELEKYLDNLISQYNTQQAQDYQTQMRDTSLTSAADQLSQLGLSTSNVITTGGANLGNVSAATNGHSNLSQQASINRYNQKMSMAKSLISMAGQMASSGIYGASLNAAKHAASTLSTAAANSGYRALSAINQRISKKDWDATLAQLGY